MTLTNDQVIRWLAEQDSQQLAELWDLADHVRRQHVGDAIHLRGLVEISSHCHRTCLYCGLRLQNRELPRYRMTADDIVSVAHEAARRKYGTVVLQAGEDPQLSVEMLCDVIRRIKSETPLAVTLSLGERPETHLRQFRSAAQIATCCVSKRRIWICSRTSIHRSTVSRHRIGSICSMS